MDTGPSTRVAFLTRGRSSICGALHPQYSFPGDGPSIVHPKTRQEILKTIACESQRHVEHFEQGVPNDHASSQPLRLRYFHRIARDNFSHPSSHFFRDGQ